MISVGDLRKNVIIELDGQLLAVLDYQHNKTARGSALVRLRLRNVRSGATFERTFQSGEKFRTVELERRQVQYQYRDNDLFHFMDTASFEQITLDGDRIGEYANYLKEGAVVTLYVHDVQPIELDLPIVVDLTVTETDPGFKGDTATAAKKAAILETGMRVLVPLFIGVGDVIRVDTRTGEYMDRAS